MTTICRHAQVCRACKHWGINLEQQKNLKIQSLNEILKNDQHPPISYWAPKTFQYRDRFDFQIRRDQAGLLDENKKITPLSHCEIMTPELLQGFNVFEKIIQKYPVIHKASGRIRTQYTNKNLAPWGLWLDLANEDIKTLLTQDEFLNELMKSFFIEIGQKRKKLFFNSTLKQFKLTDPEAHPWFSTWIIDSKKYELCETPLLSYVGAFTQPGRQTVIEIIRWLNLNVDHAPHTRTKLFEFGSGVGQYTLPLLSMGFDVCVFENDHHAIDNLKANLTAQDQMFKDNCQFYIGDFQNNENLPDIKCDIALVNPPRSGLKKFAKKLIDYQPQNIIYISCFPQSFKEDFEVFKSHYEIKKIHIVDQFLMSDHFEMITLLQRVN